jgi:CRISPR/Cas system CSM-associated protein Csm3 (group 7 of RAMP superfamily)
MDPSDRWAAIWAVIFIAAFTTIATYVAALIREICVDRPIVTKDPHTGRLYIPRSDLHVGARTRRHHVVRTR